jgi:hypothetical protein
VRSLVVYKGGQSAVRDLDIFLHKTISSKPQPIELSTMSNRELRPRKYTISYFLPPVDDESGPSNKLKAPPKASSDPVTEYHSAAKPEAKKPEVKNPTKPPTKSPPKPAKPPHLLPDPPFFAPLKHQFSPHTAYNTLSSSIQVLDVLEPIHIFRLFITDTLFDEMAQNTNEYAKKKPEDGRP